MHIRALEWFCAHGSDDGELVPRYDVRLAGTLAEVDIERPLPPLWREFDALARVPLMVIRGANSDILSPATVAAMRERHAAMVVIEVPDQGHVPLLDGKDLLLALSEFVAGCEQPRPSSIAGKHGLALSTARPSIAEG